MMSVGKTPAGGGEQSGSGSGSSGSSSEFSGYKSGSGRISGDSVAVHRLGVSLEEAGHRFAHYAGGLTEFVRYAPLTYGESDESWNQFSPSYYARGESYQGLVGAVGKALRLLGQSAVQFAKVVDDGETANAQRAKHATGRGGEPDPAGEAGNQPTSPVKSATRPATKHR